MIRILFTFSVCESGHLNMLVLSSSYFLHFLIFLQLGGLNSMLAVEHSPSIPLVSKVPTIIIGMDVSHGSPGQSDVPSIAAVTCFLLSIFFFCSPPPNLTFSGLWYFQYT